MNNHYELNIINQMNNLIDNILNMRAIRLRDVVRYQNLVYDMINQNIPNNIINEYMMMFNMILMHIINQNLQNQNLQNQNLIV